MVRLHLQGYINTQINRYWSSQNPHLTHGVLLHPKKVGGWCAVSARRIAGPAFFNETINCKIYAQVSHGQFCTELIEEERFYGWFQHDSVTAHTACISMQTLFDVFGDRITSSDILSACSLDLSPHDFFL
jgi:hypothetical protein